MAVTANNPNAERVSISSLYRPSNVGVSRARGKMPSCVTELVWKLDHYPCLIFKRFAQGLPRRARRRSAETARDRSEKSSRARREQHCRRAARAHAGGGA